MNAVQRWIDDLIQLSKKQAERNQLRREFSERLFLFAIEIGRGRKLTSGQRQAFAKTFLTAQVMLMLREDLASHPPKFAPFRNVLEEPEEEWLLKEPVIQAELEHRLHMKLTDLEAMVLSPADRQTVVTYLRLVSTACPDLLRPEEVDSIIDRLDHPLDRG